MVGSSQRNYFLPLTAAYLLIPNFIFLLGWIHPLIAIPAVALVIVGYLFFCRQIKDWAPLNSLSVKNLVFIGIAALCFAFLAGIGGFLPQGGDFIKHNLIYHDLVHLNWPVVYSFADGKDYYLCYGLGYYLPTALAGRFLGDAWMPVLNLLWTALGLGLAFYWFATLGKRPRMMLAFFLLFAVTGLLVYPLKLLGIPGWMSPLETRQQLSQTGLYHCYHDHFTKFFLQPHHGLAAWLGVAVLYELLWVKKDPRSAMFIWASCLCWSPMTCLGLLLIPVATLGRTALARYFSVANICAGGALLAVSFVYFHGHLPLTQKGLIFQLAPLSTWLPLYLLFLILELNILFVIFLLDWKHGLLAEIRPLFYPSAILLIVLPIFKAGACSDLRLQAGAPAILLVGMVTLHCFRSPLFNWKRPLFFLLTLDFMLGAIYPATRPVVMRLVDQKDYSYSAVVKEHNCHNLGDFYDPGVDVKSQYFGSPESVAARFLLR